MRKILIALLGSCIFAVASVVAISAPASAVNYVHTGGKAATHMQLKNSSGDIVCSAYNTSAATKPSASCPGGTYLEQLFDKNWKQIGSRTVKTGQGSSDPIHIGARSAVHMELKNSSGTVVCSKYNTNAAAKPVARCPRGMYLEQLFDENWRQTSSRTVKVS